MKYIQGTPRDQLCLYSDTLDSLIDEDHIVRFIDAYIDSLNFDDLGLETPTKKKDGRPPYKPQLYLKIYIYCWLNAIKRSSRAIERECKRNIELIWLTEQLSPAYWALAHFRKKNENVLENIFYEFREFCKRLDLLSYEYVAIDGTKMRAQNSRSNIYKRETIDALQEKVEAKITEYLKELDENDKKEDEIPEFLNEDLTKKLTHLAKHKEKLEDIKKEFEKNPDLKTYYANDSDCRLQSDKGKKNPGYNCQTAVDSKHHLISDVDVCSDPNDLNQLVKMKNKVKDTKKNSK